MNLLMIVLRIIHIFAGVFWAGGSMVNVGYLQPAVAATGAEGQKFMGYLARQTRFLTVTYTAATLSLLSGLTMYGLISGFRLAFLTTGYGLTLAVGGTAGLITWIIVMFVIRNIFKQMAVIGGQIQSQGGPPTPAQGAQMKALGAQLARIARVALSFLMVALLGMSIAQYVTF